MRIAFTGSSSVGKTYLADSLVRDSRFQKYKLERLNVDARAMLRSMGWNSTSSMTAMDWRRFQESYYFEKVEIEKNCDCYVVERSFIDIEAFWSVRDSIGSDAGKYSKQCKSLSEKYDIHIYLPFGIVPFRSDGFRSTDLEFHMTVDMKIHALLSKWKLSYITLDFLDINQRVESVLKAIDHIHIQNNAVKAIK